MADKRSNKVTKKISRQMIIAFSSLITFIIVLTIIIFSTFVSSSLKTQTSQMLTSLNTEARLSADQKIRFVKQSVEVFLSDNTFLQMSAAGDISANQNEDIKNELVSKINKSASVYELSNFVLTYVDGTYIGVVSDETKVAADRGTLYYTSSDILGNSAAVWTVELTESKNLVSYIYRIDESTILISSFDSSELINILDAANYLDNMRGYISDKKFMIECASDDSIVPGTYIKSNESRLIYVVGGIRANKEYIIASSVLENGWLVITLAPQKDVMKSIYGSTGFIIVVSLLLLFVAIIYIIFMTNRIIGGVDRTVDKLNNKSQNDLLTGLLNKKTFEESVKFCLDNPIKNCSYALVFMDVDNFKGVNDKCGHEMGDEVLRSFSHSIGATFREMDIKGRLGGDEFAVLMMVNSTDRNQVIRIVNDACRRFRDRLHLKANSARQSIPAVTSSIGAAIWKGNGEGFEALYRKADTALYSSKEKGKDTWSIYGLTEADLKSALDSTDN